MASRNLALRAFTWAIVLTSIFVLTLGAVIISVVIGNWILFQTGILGLSWVIGILVMLGFLMTLGLGVGVWMFFRGVYATTEETNRAEQISRLLRDTNVIDRD